MATSERILTNIAGTPDVPQAIPRPSLISSNRPVWRRAVVDCASISLGLALVPVIFRQPLLTALPQHSTLSPFIAAMMVTTIFAFAGSYRRHRTPLDIAETEGLIRGVACVTMLFAIGFAGTRTVPDRRVMFTAGLIFMLLVLQRELVHVLSRSERFRWRSKPSADFSAAERNEDGFPTLADDHAAYRLHTRTSAANLVKRSVDISVSLLVLILAMPLLVMVAVLIKLDSAGPVFIRQRRIGRWGVPFCMWKFRSMHANVARYARSPISDNDPRLTRFGRVLRRLSLDELPQLVNVIRGEMSLVGPRPEMPFIVEQYGANERLRLNAVPGITGLWQISPARAMPIHANLQLDLFYIENQNAFLDFAILLRTVTAVVRGIGAT